jgi:archaeal flagellin FlaB
MLTKFGLLIKNYQKGITGLETAIILIAFVVVAAVFAYSVLSAGLFSSQKSQEAVYKGLEETQGTIEVRGAVIAKAAHTGMNGYLSQLTFTLSHALGGSPIDFTPPTPNPANNGLPKNGSANQVTISYIDPNLRVVELYWTLSKMGSSDADNLLDAGEKFQITVGADIAGADGGIDGGNLVDALSAHHLGPSTVFSLEVKPPKGASLNFERVTPSYIESIMNLN